MERYFKWLCGLLVAMLALLGVQAYLHQQQLTELRYARQDLVDATGAIDRLYEQVAAKNGISPIPQPTSTPEPPVSQQELAPAPSPAPAPYSGEASIREDIVYVSRSGKKYHRADCRTLKADPIRTTREDAEAAGKTACRVCEP